MTSLTKIFVAEQDCESLINTMLWLEQFADLEVYGGSTNAPMIKRQVEEVQPDVVLLGLDTSNPESLPIARLLKSATCTPAILLVQRKDDNVENLLAAECDGQIGPATRLKELPEIIKRAAQRKRIALSQTTVPMAKAG